MQARWFPYEKLPKYPHLRQYESAIFEKFIENNPSAFHKVAYDFTLQTKSNPIAKAPPKIKDNWNYLTSFKIDALCQIGNDLCIVELKTAAQAGSIGQMLLYNKLFRQQERPKNTLFLLLIAEIFTPDVIELANDFGIQTVSIGYPNARNNTSNFILSHDSAMRALIRTYPNGL